MGASGEADLQAAALLALVLLAVYFLAWPGPARVRAADLAGYWAAADGAIYRLAAPGGAALRASGGAGPPLAGGVRGVRRVWLAPPERNSGEVPLRPGAAGARRGWVLPGGGRIRWDGGALWRRQGAPAR